MEREIRVSVVSGNSIDTLLVFLATTGLGGIFPSSSADMCVNRLDRFLQIKSKLVFMDQDAGFINGVAIVDEFRGMISQFRFRKPSCQSDFKDSDLWYCDQMDYDLILVISLLSGICFVLYNGRSFIPDLK